MLGTVFAAPCRLCDSPLDAHFDLPFCDACLTAASFSEMNRSLCAVCGEALAPDSGSAFSPSDMLCEACALEPRAFTHAAAAGDYTGTLRDLIHQLKYSGVHSAAVPLGRWAADAADRRLSAASHDVVLTAVPLFESKRRQRGFNQSELLAHSVAVRLRSLGWTVNEQYDVLTRRRDTRSQFELNPRQRRANLRGAFLCGPQQQAHVRGKDVVLVDDIMTSGATAHACATALRRAGAAKVWVITAARSQPPMFATFQQGEW